VWLEPVVERAGSTVVAVGVMPVAVGVAVVAVVAVDGVVCKRVGCRMASRVGVLVGAVPMREQPMMFPCLVGEIRPMGPTVPVWMGLWGVTTVAMVAVVAVVVGAILVGLGKPT